MFHADPRGILTLLAIAMCWALAVVLYRVGPPGSVARRLSLLLVVEGVTLGSSSSIEFLLVSPSEAFRLHPGWTQAEFVVHTLVAVPLIAYGILRTQLFDIDLRIRWTIRQSTVAAAVVAIVNVTSEGASRLLSYEFGNAAVAEAQQGGEISPKERALLMRLRDSLGISAVVADTLERDVKAKAEGKSA